MSEKADELNELSKEEKEVYDALVEIGGNPDVEMVHKLFASSNRKAESPHYAIQGTLDVTSAVNYIRSHARKLCNYADLVGFEIKSKTDQDKWVRIAEQTDMIRLRCRDVLEKSYVGQDLRKNKEKIEESSCKVKISSPSGCIMKIEMYPLISVAYNGAYNCYKDVWQAVSSYARSTGLNLDAGRKYLLEFHKIYAESSLNRVRRRAIQDSDKIEYSRVTNAICDGLGITDAYDHMAFLYDAEDGETEKMEIMVKIY